MNKKKKPKKANNRTTTIKNRKYLELTFLLLSLNDYLQFGLIEKHYQNLKKFQNLFQLIFMMKKQRNKTMKGC
jgi:hypothetical protein